MSGWIYLIRNGGLHKIGITQNFEQRMNQLKPDAIVAKKMTDNYVELERQLHNEYATVRLPQTEYFRLTSSDVNQVKQTINKAGDTSLSLTSSGFWDTEFGENLFGLLVIFCLVLTGIFVSKIVNFLPDLW